MQSSSKTLNFPETRELKEQPQQKSGFLTAENLLKFVFISFVVLLLSGLLGCRYCSSPFDYCCPTYTGNGDDSCNACDPNYRAGSSLYGSEHDCKGCGSCGGGGCSSCASSHYSSSQYTSSGEEYLSSGETEVYDSDSEAASSPPVKSVPTPIKKAPPPPNTPKVGVPKTTPAVPSASETSSTLKSGTSRTVSATTSKPLPKKTTKLLAPDNDDLPITLEELQQSDPSAVDVRILNVEDGTE